MNRFHVLFSVVVCILLSSATLSAAEPETTSALKFSRIMVVVLENQDLWVANLNSHFSSLAEKGMLLTNYKATTHPSQPNYIAMIAGDTMGVSSDSDFDVEGRNLVDLLEENGVTWKAYQEGYPGSCFAGDTGRYRRKHNPFISFNDVRNAPARCAKIVDAGQLWTDLQTDQLPQFMFYTPDMDNNGHDTGVAFTGKWASEFMHKLLKHQAIKHDTLIVLTFDEGSPSGENIIYTLLVGPGIGGGLMDDTRYTHYSLLKTIEPNFELGTLGRHDETAKPFHYSHNPPGFMLTVPVLVMFLVGGLIVFISILVFAVFMIRRTCANRVSEKNEKFDLLQDRYQEDA